MSRRKQRTRSPRWAVPCGPHGAAAGLPGRMPSRESRRLASLPQWANLPPGQWFVSDWAAALLAQSTPTLSTALHVATGANFRLLSAGDQILALAADDAPARRLLVDHAADPSTWANGQRWRIVPNVPPTPTGRRVILDPAQMAAAGIHEEIGVDLPVGYESFNGEQRKAWAAKEMEAIALEIFEDTAKVAGRVPSQAQREAYLQSVRPGIARAVEGQRP